MILVSFNLKRDFGLPLKRSRRWRERRERVVQVIRDSKATVIGVQELSPSMREDISGLLGDRYSVLGSGRFQAASRKENDEHSDIIIKNEDAETSPLPQTETYVK